MQLEIRTPRRVATIGLFAVAASLVACHSVIIPTEEAKVDAHFYDVAPPPPDAKCDDASCAYATIGLPEPTASVYTDNGPAGTSESFRGLISLPIQNPGQLTQLISAIYTPGNAQFRQYLTTAEWSAMFAPPASTVSLVSSFLSSHGMQISRMATNGLLLEFTGSVGNFNAAFHTTLHNFTRANPEMGGAPVAVYGVLADALAPVDFVHAIAAVLSCDLPPSTGSLTPEPGEPTSDPPSPSNIAFTPAQILSAYGGSALASAGSTGQGVAIGIVSGGGYGEVDTQTFWKSFGISREPATTVVTMEPPDIRVDESTLDVEWSGAMAPQASIKVYEAPDAHDTSIIYAFNEAIGQGAVNIVSDSFSSREDSEALAVGSAYDAAAQEAAVLGITVCSSSGDGAAPDVPSASPYVTAVGGTALTIADGGTAVTETAWSQSGSGPTTFALPAWQSSVAGSSDSRVTADVALNAAPQYFWYYLGNWSQAYGTSFASPIFAGLMADVASARGGKPPIGYLNSILYTTPAAQKAFRDITQGGTPTYKAAAGWDPPTGWGAIQADKLAIALP